MAVLGEFVSGDVGQRDLLLPLIGLGAGVGLVIARAVTGIPDEALQIFLGRADVGQASGDVPFDLAADLKQFGPGPRLLA